MTPAQIATAWALLGTGDKSMAEVAAVVGVGRMTLYRHLGARGRDPAMLTLADAADAVGLSIPALRAQIAKGRLPVTAGVHATLVQRRDLDAFIESCRVAPGTLQHLRGDRWARSLGDADGSA